MGKYLHHFTTTNDFANEYIDNREHQLPWVSYNDNPECEDMKKVVYNQMNYDAVVDMREGNFDVRYSNVTEADFQNPRSLRILVICDNCQIEEGAMTYDDGIYNYFVPNYECSIWCNVYSSVGDIEWNSDCGGSEGCGEGQIWNPYTESCCDGEDPACRCEAEGGTYDPETGECQMG